MDGIEIRKRPLQPKTYAHLRQIWMLISEDPTIRLQELAQRMGLSKNGARYLVTLLAQSGCIEPQRHTVGFNIKIPYITQQFAKEGRYVRTDL